MSDEENIENEQEKVPTQDGTVSTQPDEKSSSEKDSAKTKKDPAEKKIKSFLKTRLDAKERQKEIQGINEEVLSVDDQISDSLKKGSFADKQKTKKKKAQRRALWAASAVFCVLASIWLFSPKKGGMDFGVCRVFLELSVEYPSELRLSSVNYVQDSVRIWYAQTDSFGQTRLEAMQCYYKQDPELGTLVDKVLINRRQVDPAIVDRFNKSLSTIFAYPPDLTYPPGLPDSLRALKTGG